LDIAPVSTYFSTCAFCWHSQIIHAFAFVCGAQQTRASARQSQAQASTSCWPDSSKDLLHIYSLFFFPMIPGGYLMDITGKFSKEDGCFEK
jgi:hypothetical protein